MKWVKGPRRWVPLAVGLVLAVLAAVVQDWSGPLAVAAGVAAVTYLRDTLPAWWRERQDRHTVRGEVTRRTTPTATGNSGQVMLVREAPEGYFRRRPSRLPIPYQHRDAETEARAALTGGQPLLLVGPSMAGKSRLGEYLIRQDYPDLPLWIPQPQQLPALLEAGTLGKAVVWLDELDQFLNVDSLRTDWVQLLTSNGGIVVATMRGNERAKFAGTGGVRHPQLAALERFTAVRVAADNKAERGRKAWPPFVDGCRLPVQATAHRG